MWVGRNDVIYMRRVCMLGFWDLSCFIGCFWVEVVGGRDVEVFVVVFVFDFENVDDVLIGFFMYEVVNGLGDVVSVEFDLRFDLYVFDVLKMG